ncbi:hypothetical protein C0J52_05473 [Blattella germanica]|nr:hypothetical protein C0J52_05473 [Blattella germanica]
MQSTSERKSSTGEKKQEVATPIWANHLPSPEVIPEQINLLVTSSPGSGAGFRKNTIGTYFDTGTYI